MGPGFESRERDNTCTVGRAVTLSLQWGPASRAGRGAVVIGATAADTRALQWGPASRAGRGQLSSVVRKVYAGMRFNGARLREPGEGLPGVDQQAERPLASMGPGFESRERGWRVCGRWSCRGTCFIYESAVGVNYTVR